VTFRTAKSTVMEEFGDKKEKIYVIFEPYIVLFDIPENIVL
jgi:hypothetical protein